MENENIRFFRDSLPAEIMDIGISLENMGIPEYVWKWQTALAVLNILQERRIPILGGDVYQKLESGMKATIDNWYILKKEFVWADDYLKESHRKSRDYITNYANQNGDSYYYSIVVDRLPIGKEGASL